MSTTTATPPRLKPATPPAWHRAACYGRRDAGDPTAINPYAFGSQCWIIYEQERTRPIRSDSPDSRATSPASVSSVCSVGNSSASSAAA
jgi:hypothetical protein